MNWEAVMMLGSYWSGSPTDHQIASLFSSYGLLDDAPESSSVLRYISRWWWWWV